MSKTHLALLASAGLALAAPAFAAPELIVNGGFESTTATTSQQMTTTNVTGWTNTNVTGTTTPGYNFIYLANSLSLSGTTADNAGATSTVGGNVKLWGPGDGSINGLTTSPAGKNFVAADDNYQSAAITQQVSGLQAGQTYALNFYWAGAQQSGFDGVTNDQWTVSFGSQTQATSNIAVASHAFSGWMLQTMYFTATAASQTLSFLATGTPGGAPPFSLLDGVSLMAVPEPATWGVLAGSVFGLGLMTWYRRRGSRPAGGTAA